MLVHQQFSAIDMLDVIGLGAVFPCLEHENGKLEILCHKDENLIQPVRHLHVNQTTMPSDYFTDYAVDVLVRDTC